MLCFFASDLHGREDRYHKLFEAMRRDPPDAVMLGGDLFPSGMFAMTSHASVLDEFARDFLVDALSKLQTALGKHYPRVLVIPGNDDGRFEEPALVQAEQQGVLEYIPTRKVMLGPFAVYGYPYVPPTPFRLKDWERYDVSRYVDPGCVAPEDGWQSRASPQVAPFPTIQEDLALLAGQDDLAQAIFLLHSPPYQTNLDRAELDGKMFEHCPLDVHVGSVAIRRFIETRQPRITLHGHVHESARLTGSWQDRIGTTLCMSAAHDGPELALIRFDPHEPDKAWRELL